MGNSNSALFAATGNAHVNCLKELILTGADMNTVDSKGESALMKATKPVDEPRSLL